MTVGERMKDRRKQIGMSAEEVAAQLGLSPSTVYRYENGDIEKMGIDKLGPIASALHTTPAYLMGWTADWYDYETDEDSRFSEIPIAQFESLKKHYADDLEAVWHAWEQMQAGTPHEWYSPPTSDGERILHSSSPRKPMRFHGITEVDKDNPWIAAGRPNKKDLDWYSRVIEKIIDAPTESSREDIYNSIPEEKRGLFNYYTIILNQIGDLSEEGQRELLSYIIYLKSKESHSLSPDFQVDK